MTVTDDLVKRLRSDAHMTQADGLGAMLGTAAEAADRIEALTAENERLKREVLLQMRWKTEAQDEADTLAMTLDNIANESSDTWARDKARAALAGDEA